MSLGPREMSLGPQEMSLGPLEMSLGPREISLNPREMSLGLRNPTSLFSAVYYIYWEMWRRGILLPAEILWITLEPSATGIFITYFYH